MIVLVHDKRLQVRLANIKILISLKKYKKKKKENLSLHTNLKN